MTPEFVIDIGQRVIEITLLLSAPILVLSLVVGLLVSLLQAVTQINEATLTFFPKIVVVAIALVVFMPWMLTTLISFTTEMLASFPLAMH
ncbi:MAG: flagellar biosynthesis protein FliQ [Nitrospirae bacterium]|nr:flagellar biosynthesis protein FliQ [Nitrospirota bacterium]